MGLGPITVRAKSLESRLRGNDHEGGDAATLGGHPREGGGPLLGTNLFLSYEGGRYFHGSEESP